MAEKKRKKQEEKIEKKAAEGAVEKKAEKAEELRERKNSEEKTEISNEKREANNSNALKWIIGLGIALIIIVFFGIWYSEASKKFEYGGLNFQKEMFGKILI